MLTGDVGSKSTSNELRVTSDRLRELREMLGPTGDSRCQQQAQQSNAVDKGSTLSEKRLNVLLRNLNDLKKENVSTRRTDCFRMN